MARITAVAVRDLDTGEIFRMHVGAVLHAIDADPNFVRWPIAFGYIDCDGNFSDTRGSVQRRGKPATYQARRMTHLLTPELDKEISGDEAIGVIRGIVSGGWLPIEAINLRDREMWHRVIAADQSQLLEWIVNSR